MDTSGSRPRVAVWRSGRGWAGLIGWRRAQRGAEEGPGDRVGSRAGAGRPWSRRRRILVQALFAGAIAARARAGPIGRTVGPIGAFGWARTGSILGRGADVAARARRVRGGIGRPRGFHQWRRPIRPWPLGRASVPAERPGAVGPDAAGREGRAGPAPRAGVRGRGGRPRRRSGGGRGRACARPGWGTCSHGPGSRRRPAPRPRRAPRPWRARLRRPSTALGRALAGVSDPVPAAVRPSSVGTLAPSSRRGRGAATKGASAIGPPRGRRPAAAIARSRAANGASSDPTPSCPAIAFPRRRPEERTATGPARRGVRRCPHDCRSGSPEAPHPAPRRPRSSRVGPRDRRLDGTPVQDAGAAAELGDRLVVSFDGVLDGQPRRLTDRQAASACRDTDGRCPGSDARTRATP